MLAIVWFFWGSAIFRQKKFCCLFEWASGRFVFTLTPEGIAPSNGSGGLKQHIPSSKITLWGRSMNDKPITSGFSCVQSRYDHISGCLYCLLLWVCDFILNFISLPLLCEYPPMFHLCLNNLPVPVYLSLFTPPCLCQFPMCKVCLHSSVLSTLFTFTISFFLDFAFAPLTVLGLCFQPLPDIYQFVPKIWKWTCCAFLVCTCVQPPAILCS